MADYTHTGFGFKCLGPFYLELFLTLILKLILGFNIALMGDRYRSDGGLLTLPRGLEQGQVRKPLSSFWFP